jgi:two-component sensor histidine kinase
MKVRFALLFILISVFAPALFAQNLDSLQQVWRDSAKPDTARLKAGYDFVRLGYLFQNPDTAFILASELMDLARKKGFLKFQAKSALLQGYAVYLNRQVEEALKYFKEAYAFSEKARDSVSMANSYDLIGQMYGDLGELDMAIMYLDRALKINQELGDVGAIATSYNNLSIQYSRKGDTERSLNYLHMSLQEHVRMGDSSGVANSLQNLASQLSRLGRNDEAKALYKRALAADTTSFSRRGMPTIYNQLALLSANEGKFDEGIGYAKKGLEVARSLNAKESEADILNMISSIHSRQGLYTLAIQELSEALKINEAMNNKRGIAITLANMANVQLDQKSYSDALVSYGKAKDIFEEIKFPEALSQVNSSIGNVYRDLGQFDKALASYEASLAVGRQINSPTWIAYALARKAETYFKMNELEKAQTFILQALELSDTPGDRLYHTDNLAMAGRIYQKAGNQAKAIRYGKLAYDNALDIGVLTSLSAASEVLYKAYKATGQTAKALEMHENYITYRDSINNEENTKAVLQQQMQYEYEKKEAAAKAAQDKKDALARGELSRRNLQRNASLGGFGLVAALAGVLYVNGRRRRKTNELLSQQKTEIELKSNQNELLLKEIHHRVKNNLQTISSLLHLQSAHIKDADVRKAVSEGQHRVESMALIHQKLYQRDNLSGIEMRDYLQNLVQSLIDTFDADPDRIRFDLDMPEMELDVDTAVPVGLIVNELITNSLKYAFPGGREGVITVSLQKAGDRLELLVADNGVGKANTATGTSFGSQLVRLLTTQMGGTLSQDTTHGFATRVSIPPIPS